ncbi:unnamed protein product [marine sediment metagenome]|uniref:Uncharacterized protein n=1 Tax=marine sediment metagenome TaxID=412755 RepID=X1UHV3_9ZZZZ
MTCLKGVIRLTCPHKDRKGIKKDEFAGDVACGNGLGEEVKSV